MKKKIVTIDDSMLSRSMLRKVLEGLGYEVLQAKDGKEGLQLVQDTEPDCVFLDLLMPELDGYGFLDAYNNQEWTMPVVVLTSDIQSKTKARLLELGAAQIIYKPIKSEVVEAAVSKIFKLGDTHAG